MKIKNIIVASVLSITLFVSGSLLKAWGDEPSQALKAPVEEIKILAIGNSLTSNATFFLRKLAQGGGKKMTLFVAAMGGYTLKQHVEHLQAYDADPQDPEGRPYGNKSVSLREALQKEDWNVVTIQQASASSMKLETFQPSTGILIDYIHKYAPHAKVLLFQTWAYPDDCHERLKSLKQDRLSMHEKVKSTYQEISNETGLAIIPVGNAFDKVARLEHPIVLTNPKDYHGNVHGEYLGGAVFYEAIYHDNVENNSFVPPGVTPEEAKTLLRIAHETIAESPLGETLATQKEK